MADSLDILIDDRTVIEVARHMVGRRADQLHPASMRWMIGLGALEARKW
jgi:hypothetical protein